MPSPFPGMNPWIEQEGIWPGFHNRLIVRLADAISDQVDPRYYVEIEEHLYVQEEPGQPNQVVGRADVAVAPVESLAPGPSLAVLEAPVQVHLPLRETQRQPFLEIRGQSSRDLIAVIEVISPTNKGKHRDYYLRKRDQVLISDAHLIEIDLLRGGQPLPAPDRPDCDYSVVVSRAERRPEAGFWPIALRQPLPIIPVPLRNPDRDATVDLQKLLHQIYDAGRYAHRLYRGRPKPPLRPEDREWAMGFLPTDR